MANKDILQYLRETPHNTNVNVVKTMLGDAGSGSSDGTILIYEGQLRTTQTYSSMSGAAYSASIPSAVLISPFIPKVHITFDGKDYILPLASSSGVGVAFYGPDEKFNSGHPDFSNSDYPCGISCHEGGNTKDALYTKEEGTYSVRITIIPEAHVEK